MHCIVFCIYLVVLQSYLSLFSHIPCIHFAKLDTQLDLKIDWLILSPMYILVYAIYMSELQKIFFLRDMMDNQYANIFNIFFTWFKFKDHLFMVHIVLSLHLLKERIFFFMCILNLVFKFGLCLFIYPHLIIFPQNLFCFP